MGVGAVLSKTSDNTKDHCFFCSGINIPFLDPFADQDFDLKVTNIKTMNIHIYKIQHNSFMEFNFKARAYHKRTVHAQLNKERHFYHQLLIR